VRKFSGALHKSFKSHAEAAAFVESHGSGASRAAAAAPGAKRLQLSSAGDAAEPSVDEAAECLGAEARSGGDAEPLAEPSEADGAAAAAWAAPDGLAAAPLPQIDVSKLYRMVRRLLL